MKSVILKSVTIALLGCLICSTVFAADSATRWGAVQTDAIRRILSRKPFYSEQPEKPFCATLLKDFRELMDVHLVNPVAQAQNYDDSVLSSYKARCDGLPLNEYFTCEPGDIYGVEWSNDPKEQRKQWLKLCRRYVGTRTFRIFTLDINRELKGETVLIMYSERACRITADGVSKEVVPTDWTISWRI